jgi:hypothetical protein
MAKTKSLTETAKAVIQGTQLDEGSTIPAIGPITGGVSNPNPVDGSTASTGNAKTLRPRSKAVEPRHAQGSGATGPEAFDDVEDLGGATPTSTAKENLGAKASGAEKRDRSVKGSGNNQEPPKHLEEDEEFEISEELQNFIEEAIEAGLSEEEIQDAIAENFELVSEEDEEYLEEDEEELDEEVEEIPPRDIQIDMSEDVNALLEGENLSEEFKNKATTIFEAAVKTRLEEEIAILEEAYAETLEEKVSEIMEELTSEVDNYLNYVVEKWIEENEVAIESSLRSELTEDFISSLKTVFTEHYMDIPEDKVNIVEELSSTVDELQEKLNNEIERNVELSAALNESIKNEVITTFCEGLTTVQAEKLRSLAENVDFSEEEEFIEKLETLKENYFPAVVKTDKVLDRVESQDPKMISESNLEGPMAQYVKALGAKLPK